MDRSGEGAPALDGHPDGGSRELDARSRDHEMLLLERVHTQSGDEYDVRLFTVTQFLLQRTGRIVGEVECMSGLFGEVGAHCVERLRHGAADKQLQLCSIALRRCKCEARSSDQQSRDHEGLLLMRDGLNARGFELRGFLRARDISDESARGIGVRRASKHARHVNLRLLQSLGEQHDF